MLIEGLVPTRKHPFANQVNAEIAKTLGAEIVFVATPGTNNAAQLKSVLMLLVLTLVAQKQKHLWCDHQQIECSSR